MTRAGQQDQNRFLEDGRSFSWDSQKPDRGAGQAVAEYRWLEHALHLFVGPCGAELFFCLGQLV